MRGGLTRSMSMRTSLSSSRTDDPMPSITLGPGSEDRNRLRQQLRPFTQGRGEGKDESGAVALLLESHLVHAASSLLPGSVSNSSTALSSATASQNTKNKESSEKYLQRTLHDITQTISGIVDDIEDNIAIIQRRASLADSSLINDLDRHVSKLNKIEALTSNVQAEFVKSSENGVKVGERLTIADRERNRLNSAIDLMNYIEHFEYVGKNSSQELDTILSKSIDLVREYFPESIRSYDIGKLAEILHDLRRILIDINSEEVQNAQGIIVKLSEAIENELLHIFELTFIELMSPSSVISKPIDRAKLLNDCRNLVTWLHFFNNGLSVQKKYIFTVVSQRIPVNLVNRSTVSVSTWKKLATVIAKKIKNEDSDDDSSAGAGSDDEDDAGSIHSSVNSPAQYSTGNVIDQLSELFGTISLVCQEQFTVIRMVFPENAVVRITRLLIQRIFNDPLFGIQKRVDELLSPRPVLSLGDYIEALVLVRQKLSALYVLLLEYCINPELGEKRDVTANPAINSIADALDDGKGSIDNAATVRALLEDDEDERAKSEADVKEFLMEQINQVLSSYMNDYFDHKEVLYLKQQFVDALRRAVDNGSHNSNANSILSKITYNNSTGSVQAGSILTLPKLRAEKMKSIQMILDTVANRKYLNSIFSSILDSLHRITVIERDDRKLSLYFKEVFHLLIGFLIDGILLPICQAATIILLKFSTGNGGVYSIPPQEYLDLLAAVYWAVTRLHSFFTDNFIQMLSNTSRELSKTNNISQNAMNTITICKESKRRSLKSLEKVSRESLHAWTLCVGIFVEKTLLHTQIKHDYNPKGFDPSLTGATIAATTAANAATAAANAAANKVISKVSNIQEANLFAGKYKSQGVESTVACDTICKALLEVSNAIRDHIDDISGINLHENFWMPLGRQIIGSIISHMRRQKISIDGAKVIMKDLNEYYNVMVVFEAPENIDMMLCLKDIAAVYSADEEDVLKIVIEGLRHLDTAVVLALVRARTDFQKGNASWAKKLVSAYGTIKWDVPLPWETKKNMTIVSFAESAAAGNKSQALGPSTLRKLSVPVSSLMIQEYAKNSNDMNNFDMSIIGQGIGFNDGPPGGYDPMINASSFAPVRPESSNVNNLLTSYGNNNDMSNNAFIDPLVASHISNQINNAQALDFINRNTILSSVESANTHKDDPFHKSGLSNILHKVQDKAAATSSQVRESASHLITNVKHAVNADDIHLPKNPFTNTGFMSHASNDSGTTKKKFDKDAVKNIFTSPQLNR